MDAGKMKAAGDELMGELRSILSSRATAIVGDVSRTLAQYFDPKTGVATQRIESLVRKDGELERLLESQIGDADSTLSKTLAAHVGAQSPVFRLLSPTETMGLKSQIGAAVEEALKKQRETLLREFSLDNRDSALSRLVAEVSANEAVLAKSVKGDVATLVGEFSLDRPGSALSRLVARVEATQKAIADQFSSDSETSTLNKLSLMLEGTRMEIGRHLSLDDDKSALSRLKRELRDSVDSVTRSTNDFQTEVRATLASIAGKREEAQKSTRHGTTFQEQLGEFLSCETQRVGDILEETGAKPGLIRNSKVGDFLALMGKESAAPGARLVFEAKDNKSYDIKSALEEAEVARKNRDAQLALFVFSKTAAPASLEPLVRIGDAFLVKWDPEDQATDLNVRVAYGAARALAIRKTSVDKQTDTALREIELSVRAIEKQLSSLDQMKTWSETVHSSGSKLVDRAQRMRSDLEQEVTRLDECVRSLTTRAPE